MQFLLQRVDLPGARTKQGKKEKYTVGIRATENAGIVGIRATRTWSSYDLRT